MKISRECIAEAQALRGMELHDSAHFNDRLAVLDMRREFVARYGVDHITVLSRAAQYAKRSL